MKRPVLIKIALEALLIPLIAMFLLHKFNLFNYITFIPENYRFDAGLTCYLAILEALFETVIYFLSKQQADIVCVYYRDKREMNITNAPVIVCEESMGGTASFRCHVKISGNIKRLRSAGISMELPSWVTAQIERNDLVMSYENNTLSWDFKRLLPEKSDFEQFAEYDSKIGIIRTQADNSLSIKVQPQFQNKRLFEGLGIRFKSNHVVIMNKE